LNRKEFKTSKRLMNPNEPVGKVLWINENDVFRGHLTLPRHEIVDCSAFCEIIFFYISSKNLLGDFFYSLNVAIKHPNRHSGDTARAL